MVTIMSVFALAPTALHCVYLIYLELTKTGECLFQKAQMTRNMIEGIR